MELVTKMKAKFRDRIKWHIIEYRENQKYFIKINPVFSIENRHHLFDEKIIDAFFYILFNQQLFSFLSKKVSEIILPTKKLQNSLIYSNNNTLEIRYQSQIIKTLKNMPGISLSNNRKNTQTEKEKKYELNKNLISLLNFKRSKAHINSHPLLFIVENARKFMLAEILENIKTDPSDIKNLERKNTSINLF